MVSYKVARGLVCAGVLGSKTVCCLARLGLWCGVLDMSFNLQRL